MPSQEDKEDEEDKEQEQVANENSPIYALQGHLQKFSRNLVLKMIISPFQSMV